MAPAEGLLGLDTSLTFSAEPLDHVFLIIPGAGDPYIDHPPWLSSLENCVRQLSANYERLTRRTRTPSALFLPVQWHRPAFDTWQQALRDAHPAGAARRVRAAVAETLGDVLLPASPFWRAAIARHLAEQIEQQLAAVRRNRPNFSGRISLVAHSVGALLAVELLHARLLPAALLDAVIFIGCPLPAYAALAPDRRQVAIATVQTLRSRVRFFNVFHPLDPVAYRLEPFVLPDFGDAVTVTPQTRTFWDDAGLFWDDVVNNLWTALFPRGKAGGGSGSGSGTGSGTGSGNGNISGDGNENRNEDGRGAVELAEMLRQGRARRDAEESADDKAVTEESSDTGTEEELRRAANYKTNGVFGRREVLLDGRMDFELQDGTARRPLDVMASWGAIKAHSYYWQCAGFAQMLVDVALTSDEALRRRGGQGWSCDDDKPDEDKAEEEKPDGDDAFESKQDEASD